MSKKSGGGLEKHIDKIVLGVAGLIGLYVLYAYVLMPSAVIERNGTKYGPGDLDIAIREEAKTVEDMLAKPPKQEKSYQPKSSEFKSLLATAINGVNDNIYFPSPHPSADTYKPIFEVPAVCDLNNVKARLMTAVAYVPKKTLEIGDVYASAETNPADMDLVTVEGTIDVAELCNRFSKSLVVKSSHALANDAWTKPVFAAVDLERQELLDNGSWGEWQAIPRTKIDDFRNYLKIPQKTDKLDKSVELLMLQFDKPDVKKALLQPRTYDLAYPLETWLPPGLAQKRQERLDKEKADMKRQEVLHKVEAEKTAHQATTRPAATTGAAGKPAPAMPGGMGGGGMPGMGGGMPGMAAAPSQTRTTTPATVKPPPAKTTPVNKPATSAAAAARNTKNVMPMEALTQEQDFAKALITDQTVFTAMKEPLLLWAHDDTTMPGRTYRYRMRVGVFNPAAGTDSFRERDKALKNDVILWSAYSAVTESIAVPTRWCILPSNCRDGDKMVTTTVCRYLLAKWYSHLFMVKPGEMIGSVIENAGKQENSTEPNEIDYSIGAVMIDAVTAPEGDHSDMLYTMDGNSVVRLAAKQSYWPGDLKAKDAEIAHLQKEPAPVLKPRGTESQRGSQPAASPRTMPGMMPGMPGMMPGMPMPGMPGR